MSRNIFPEVFQIKNAEAYPGLTQTSKMEHFETTVNDF